MPSRRSSRTSAGTPSVLEVTSTGSTSQGSKRPPKKQQKTQHADPTPEIPKRGRGGKLRKLTEMPLDILFEIFGELNPLDVLNLARSSKPLRNILLRRSAVSIWKKALSNISGLPACPVYLSEPQYTNLAFDRHCHSCSANTQDVYWEYNIRCCSSCFNRKFSRNPLTNKSISSRALVERVYELLPAFSNTNRRGFLADLVRPIKEARCLLGRLEEFQNDETGLNRFIEEQRSHFQQVRVHARLCNRWQSEVGRQRALELDEIRKRRKEAIIAKLRDLGWGEEIDNERGSYRRNRTLLINHPLVRQSKELTERIWNNIKPALVELMTNKRDTRLKAEWRTQVSARIRMAISVVDAFTRRYIDQWFPNSIDFCLIDEFRALILDPSTDNSTITEASFKAIESCIPDAARGWRLSQSRSLLELLPEGMNGTVEDATSQTDDPSPRLELATTFFSCKICLGMDIVPQSRNKSAKKEPHPITYSRILTHSCLNDPSPVNDEDPNFEILSRLPAYKQPWDLRGDIVKFHRAASIIAHNVVTACGKDPAVTTASEMDEQDFRVECRRCSKGASSRLVMTWTMAICHSIECHSEKKGGSRSWNLLDDDDAQKVRVLEAAQLEEGKHQLSKDFRCTRCGRLQSKAGLSEHLRYSHSILRPAEEGDFSKHPDVPMYRPPFAVRLNIENGDTSADS